jgi:GTP-binding protein
MIDPDKYYCDAALVGFPGAGKSTLFNTLTGRTDSRTMPRFAPILERQAPGEETAKSLLADIGGISRGAAGKNPGTQWLAYVEKSKLLIFVVSLKQDTRRLHLSPLEKCAKDFFFLIKAVCIYKKDFTEKKRVIVLNRFTANDEMFTEELIRQLNTEEYIPNETILPVCAATGGGAAALLKVISVSKN